MDEWTPQIIKVTFYISFCILFVRLPFLLQIKISYIHVGFNCFTLSLLVLNVLIFATLKIFKPFWLTFGARFKAGAAVRTNLIPNTMSFLQTKIYSTRTETRTTFLLALNLIGFFKEICLLRSRLGLLCY